MQFYGADTRAKGIETEEGKSNQGPDTGINSFVTVVQSCMIII